MTVAVLFGALLLLMFMGVPIAISIAAASLIAVAVDGSLPMVLGAHRMVAGIDSFPLVAVPFFILAGSLMNASGIADRLFAFAHAAIGWMRGGLAQVNVGASVIFAGMSGSAVADAGGLGNIEVRAMAKAGYDKEFAVAVSAASAVIGPVIPPSLTLIVFGFLSSTSVGQLFIAGILPGLLMAATQMILIFFIAKRRGYPRDAAFSMCRLWETFKHAFLPLLAPVVIIGGILFGIFTPTEAAIVAVVYSLLLGVFYGELTTGKVISIGMETIETTAIIMFIMAGAALFGWILTSNHIASGLAELVLSATDNKYLILIGINLILLLVGCFLEPTAALTILVPIVIPVTNQLGIDPVQVGIIFLVNLMIGLITPPVGLVLHVLSRVSNVPFERCVVASLPFLVPLFFVLALVTFVPQISLFLPTVFFR